MKFLTTSAVVLSALLLTACGSDNDKSNAAAPVLTDHLAVINMADPSYGDYDLALVDLTATSLSVNEGGYSGNGNDFALAGYGSHFYRIGRLGIDSITKYSINNPTTPLYTYSTLNNPDDSSSNPYDLVFVSERKAYLIQYELDKLWIVDPSATTEAAFKIGEVDLSNYADSDGIPEMSAGVIVDGKLYLTLQRLDRNNSWKPSNGSQLAVIDTTSDTVLNIIDLQTTNPNSIVYHADAGLFVQSDGDHLCFACSPKTSSGGIEKIDLTNLSSSVILADNPSYGINKLAVVSATQAYVSLYNGWGDNDVYAFNPSTGNLAAIALDNLESVEIRGLHVYDNKLWVGIADYSNPRINLYNLTDETPAGQLATRYYPEKIVFLKAYE